MDVNYIPSSQYGYKKRMRVNRNFAVFVACVSALTFSLMALLLVNLKQRDVNLKQGDEVSLSQYQDKEVLGIQKTTKCFNRIINVDGDYYWMDGCRGDPYVQMCFSDPVKLTEEELYAFKQWVAKGRQIADLDPNCVP